MATEFEIKLRAGNVRQLEKILKDPQVAGHALEKLREEAGELEEAVREDTNVAEELGDLLFAAVKVGRFLGLDSELALHAACEKFIRRFRRTEELAGQPMTQMELSDLERFWAQAKRDSDSTSMT